MDFEKGFVEVEVISDPVAVAECWFKAHLEGDPMVCHRCEDPCGWIIAILVVPAGSQDFWPLCGGCLRSLPHRESIL